MKTSFPKPAAKAKWYVVDADGLILGRLATEIATVLRGRHRPDYVPHWASGDHVIVLNAGKIKVTGDKVEQKKYYHHAGYLGHLRQTTLKRVLEKTPEKAIEMAVKGMLPKNPTRQHTMKQLHVYVDATHAHAAQSPVPLPL